MIQNYRECLQILLENRANINQANEKGDTILMQTIQDNSRELFEEILKHQPNVNAANKAGQTPLYLAAKQANTYYFIKLLTYNKNNDELETDPSKIVDLTRKYENGKNILHLAAENSSFKAESISLIIDSGVEFDSEDNGGNIPLYYAVLNSASEDVIKLLISLGSDPSHTNTKSRSAFSVASPEMAQILSKYAMDPTYIENRQNRKREMLERQKEEAKERVLMKKSKAESPTGNERSKTASKEKRALLLSMTNGYGTLRPLKKFSQEPSSAKKQTTGNKFATTSVRRESRPWGGSKEAAMFQRQTRIQLREMKNEIFDCIKELQNEIKSLKAEINGDSSLFDENSNEAASHHSSQLEEIENSIHQNFDNENNEEENSHEHNEEEVHFENNEEEIHFENNEEKVHFENNEEEIHFENNEEENAHEHNEEEIIIENKEEEAVPEIIEEEHNEEEAIPENIEDELNNNEHNEEETLAEENPDDLFKSTNDENDNFDIDAHINQILSDSNPEPIETDDQNNDNHQEDIQFDADNNQINLDNQIENE